MPAADRAESGTRRRVLTLVSERGPITAAQVAEILGLTTAGDANLAVLASPPEAYAAYASAVRLEYGHVPDDRFTAGRIAVLEQLLALPRLYRLPAVAEAWESRARANMTAELTLLRSRAASAGGASGRAAPPPAAG